MSDSSCARTVEILKEGAVSLKSQEDAPGEFGWAFEDLLVPWYDRSTGCFQPGSSREVGIYFIEELIHFELQT